MVKLNLIVVLAVAVLTLAFGLGLVRPGLGELRASQHRLAEEQAKVQEAQNGLGSIGELYASILQLDEAVRDFHSRLPTERRFGEFLSDLSQSLENSRITDYVVQPKPVLEVVDSRLPAALRLAAGSNILPVNIAFQSTTAQAFEFLNAVERLPRLVHVESVKLVNDEGHPGTVKVDMMLHTYQYAGTPPGRDDEP
jgi:Tfp pilus assembly protein PilO